MGQFYTRPEAHTELEEPFSLAAFGDELFESSATMQEEDTSPEALEDKAAELKEREKTAEEMEYASSFYSRNVLEKFKESHAQWKAAMELAGAPEINLDVLKVEAVYFARAHKLFRAVRAALAVRSWVSKAIAKIKSDGIQLARERKALQEDIPKWQEEQEQQKAQIHAEWQKLLAEKQAWEEKKQAERDVPDQKPLQLAVRNHVQSLFISLGSYHLAMRASASLEAEPAYTEPFEIGTKANPSHPYWKGRLFGNFLRDSNA